MYVAATIWCWTDPFNSLFPSLTVEAASANGRSEGSLCWTVYEASEIESTGFGQICGRRAVSLAHIGIVVGRRKDEWERGKGEEGEGGERGG